MVNRSFVHLLLQVTPIASISEIELPQSMPNGPSPAIALVGIRAKANTEVMIILNILFPYVNAEE